MIRKRSTNWGKYAGTLLVFLCGVGFGTSQLWAQLKPYDPARLSVLEKKLAQTEIKTEQGKVLIDLHDQWMYSNSAKAYGYNNQALNIAQQLKDEYLLARAYGNKGNEFFDAGDLEQALGYYLKSNTYPILEKYPLIEALNYSNMSNVYGLKGDIPTAMEYGFRAIEICKNHPEGLNLQCHTRANLAECYLNLRQYEKAEYLLNLSLKELRGINSPAVKAMTYGYLGEVYKHKQDYKRAIALLKAGLREAEPAGLDYFTANLYANLGELHHADQNPQQGLFYARQGHYLSNLNEDAQVQTKACRTIAKIFLTLNRLDSAQHYAKLALAITAEKGIQSLRPSVLMTYATIAKQLGEYTPSLKAMEEARALEKSMASERAKTESIQRLEAFSVFEAKHHIRHLYADQLKYAQFLHWMNSLGIVLTLLIGLGVFSLYRQRQKMNVLLTQKGQDIENQRQELADLNEIKAKLFTAISNELRIPLSSIQQVLADLDKDKQLNAPQNHDTDEEVLTMLQQQTIRTVTLLEDLLFTARVQMNQYRPLRQEFLLQPMIRELERQLRLLNPHQFTPIIYQVPPDLSLYCDATMLKMVVRNLLLIIMQKNAPQQIPISLEAWRENEEINIRFANVMNMGTELSPPIPIQSIENPKPYWDLGLIQTFIEGYGGQFIACLEGKGYQIILPDRHG